MAGEWLDKIFSPVRQELVGRLGSAYTNATGSYTTILTQQVTAGRFSQPGATTTLVIRALVAFESAAGGTFALSCNGTTIEVSAKPGGGGAGTTSGTVQTRTIEGAAELMIIGRVSELATIENVWILPEDTITASDTDYRDWTFYTYLPDGTTDGTIANVTSKTSGSGGLGALAALSSTEIAPDTPGVQVSAGGSIGVYEVFVGSPVAVPYITYGCDYTIAGAAGDPGILHGALTLSIAVPLGTYTATLTGKALGGGTITIDPEDAEPGGATIEITEFAT